MKIKSAKTVFECPIFKVEERQVQIDKGIEQTHWVVVRQPNVTVVALTSNKQILLIKDVRGKNNEQTLELPGGKIESYEPTKREAIKQALQELESETGYRAHSIELLEIFEPVSNWRERKYYHFAAWNLEERDQELEEGETIVVVKKSLSEIKKILKENRLSFGDESRAIEKALAFFIAYNIMVTKH